MSNFHPCPKPPADKKKQKPANGYKDKNNRYCIYTGQPGAERHEVYGGSANREISIRNKFQIDLCQEVHEHFTNPMSWFDLERIRFWKEYFQMKIRTLTDVSGNAF